MRDQLALHAREAGLIVVLDAKRGDIGVSSEHYAASAFSRPSAPADWVTISPYLGADGMQPFLEQGAAFALVRTSNPGGTALQTLPLEDGRTVAQAVADMVRELGEAFLDTKSQWSRLGAVVGATHAAEIAELRARMPKQWFLMPGVGAQGGSAADVAGLCRRHGGLSECQCSHLRRRSVAAARADSIFAGSGIFMKRFGTILLVGVAVLLLVPAFMRSSPSSQLGPGVVVMTPHNEQIRFELGSRFSQWHQREFSTDAHVAWSTPGGTSEIRKLLQSQWKAAAGAAFHLGVTLIWCSAAVRMSTVSSPSRPSR